jgi:SAM-dependent methyltransferase
VQLYNWGRVNSVTGVDISQGMLTQAAARVAREQSLQGRPINLVQVGHSYRAGQQALGLATTQVQVTERVPNENKMLMTGRHDSLHYRSTRHASLAFHPCRCPSPAQGDALSLDSVESSSIDTVLDTYSLCVLPDPLKALQVGGRASVYAQCPDSSNRASPPSSTEPGPSISSSAPHTIVALSPLLLDQAMARVVKPGSQGGRVLLLEHARSDNPLLGAYQVCVWRVVATTPGSRSADVWLRKCIKRNDEFASTAAVDHLVAGCSVSFKPPACRPCLHMQDATADAVAATAKGCVWNQRVPELVAAAGLRVVRLTRHTGGTLVMVEAVRD